MNSRIRVHAKQPQCPKPQSCLARPAGQLEAEAQTNSPAFCAHGPRARRGRSPARSSGPRAARHPPPTRGSIAPASPRSRRHGFGVRRSRKSRDRAGGGSSSAGAGRAGHGRWARGTVAKAIPAGDSPRAAAGTQPPGLSYRHQTAALICRLDGRRGGPRARNVALPPLRLAARTMERRRLDD